MCYNTRYMTKDRSVYADHYGVEEETIPLFNKMYYANGFDHFDIPVITGEDPALIQSFSWGLIPGFTNPEKYPIPAVQSSGLNARDDKLMNNFKWKSVVKRKRCIVVLDAFYEYHHAPGVKLKVPYHISSSHEPTLSIAGIWDTWQDRNDAEIVRSTVCIVTTEANEKMAEIHNNPDLKKRNSGPRMPAVLDVGGRRLWLSGDDADNDLISEVIKPYPVDGLVCHTVNTLSSKSASGSGNTIAAIEEHDWPIIGLP